MIIRLVKAPINWFHDTIPRGQIYNRLTKDLDTCLFNYYSLKGTIDCFLRCISSFILCAIYDISSLKENLLFMKNVLNNSMSQNLINICADIDNFCQIYSSS